MIHPGGTIPLLSENRNRCPILPRCNMNGCRGQEENPKRCLGLNALYSRYGIVAEMTEAGVAVSYHSDRFLRNASMIPG